MRTVEYVLALREGGRSKRCHTMPSIGEPTVDEHSWQMLSLLHALRPGASKELIWAIVFHDVAERWTGDTPADVKYGMEPALGQALKRAEERVEHALMLNFLLDEDEQTLLKSLDCLEFFLWCHDQLNLGNQAVRPALDNVNLLLLGSAWVPEDIKEFVREFKWQRTTVVDRAVMKPIQIKEVTR